MNAASHGHIQRRANNLPTVCSRCSDCCLHVIFSLVVCWREGSRRKAVPSGLYLSQAHWPLKLQNLALLIAKTHKIQPLSFSHTNRLGEMFSLYIPLCASLPLTLTHDHGLPPHSIAALIYFSPTPCLHTSYLLWVGLFSPFSCGVSSANL